MKKPILLIILDGWGIGAPWGGNAISLAKTPFFDNCWSRYPKTSLFASGVNVGLTGNEPGNSEVGHFNLGAGRVMEQTDTRISKSIADGSFYRNKAFLDTIFNCKKNNSVLHLIGLLSDGKVHSDYNHLLALLDLAKKYDLQKLFIHIITDGRDTPPMSALLYIEKLIQKMNELKIGKIVTLSGRYYAMDRDNRLERTKLAYNAVAKGIGKTFNNVQKAISDFYNQGINDEFITPSVLNNNQYSGIQDGDSVIFFNFRADRARQLSQAIYDNNFKDFERKQVNKLFFCSMVPYNDYSDSRIHSAFMPDQKINNTLPEVVSNNGLKQMHIAETEKYAHVTYFFGGGHEKAFKNQDNYLIPSPRVSQYNQSPRMSADKITAQIVKRMLNYDFLLVNYANPDMVGHTGDLQATIKACEAVDENLAILCQKSMLVNATVLITADHGNAEQMLNQHSLEPYTEHTSSKVPFIIFSKNKYQIIQKELSISSVAPTVLKLLNLNIPQEMTSPSLI